MECGIKTPEDKRDSYNTNAPLKNIWDTTIYDGGTTGRAGFRPRPSLYDLLLWFMAAVGRMSMC